MVPSGYFYNQAAIVYFGSSYLLFARQVKGQERANSYLIWMAFDFSKSGEFNFETADLIILHR